MTSDTAQFDAVIDSIQSSSSQVNETKQQWAPTPLEEHELACRKALYGIVVPALQTGQQPATEQVEFVEGLFESYFEKLQQSSRKQARMTP